MNQNRPLSTTFTKAFFRRRVTRMLTSIAITTAFMAAGFFMLKTSTIKEPVETSLQSGASISIEPLTKSMPTGLSRQRKDFEKAIDLLAVAATTSEGLADYFDRVDKRVKGEAFIADDASGVRKVSRIKAQGATSSKGNLAATVTDGEPHGSVKKAINKLKGYIGGGMHSAAKPAEQGGANAGASQTGDSLARAASLRLTTGDIAFELNPAIDRWVRYYTSTQGGRNTMRVGIDRSSAYLNMAREEFRNLGLPEDLVWLAHVESVWHSRAMSPAAAGGIWQFIPRTATDYGLKVGEEVDERLDPAKQTRVAALYLKDLYTIFGDWALAMAAYNCGEPRVMEAIVKNGRANFWELRDKRLLPEETCNYVPKILAAIKVAGEAETHGFWPQADEAMDVAGR